MSEREGVCVGGPMDGKKLKSIADVITLAEAPGMAYFWRSERTRWEWREDVSPASDYDQPMVLDDVTAEQVLIAHQRHTPSACLCGWDQLGASHAAHQWRMLKLAAKASYRT